MQIRLPHFSCRAGESKPTGTGLNQWKVVHLQELGRGLLVLASARSEASAAEIRLPGRRQPRRRVACGLEPELTTSKEEL